MSTLYFSKFSNKIIYLLYKSKKVSITFENIQIKHAHVKDDNQSSFKIFKFNFQKYSCTCGKCILMLYDKILILSINPNFEF